MLLRILCLIYLTTERFEDGIEVSIDHERCHGVELVIVELQLLLFRTGRWKHMNNRHEVIASAQLCMPRVAFFSFKMSKAPEANIQLFFVFCYIFEQTGNAGDWCVMYFPIK